MLRGTFPKLRKEILVLRLSTIIVKFQTWSKQLRCLLNISKLTRPPGSPSIPRSLLQGLTAISPPSTLTSPGQGLDSPSSRGSSLYNSTILITHPLVSLASSLQHLVPLSPRLLFPPHAPQGSGPCPRWTLSDVSAPGYELPCIYNKPVPPPYLVGFCVCLELTDRFLRILWLVPNTAHSFADG